MSCSPRSALHWARLLLFAGIGGALTGFVSYAFLWSLDWATRTRIAHGWLVWLLPVVGIAVGAAYHYLGGRAKGGTPAVIEQGHHPEEQDARDAFRGALARLRSAS